MMLALRSLLFVPLSKPERVAKATESAADGVILDLEDGVAPGDKEMARAAIGTALSRLGQKKSFVGLRINRFESGGMADLEAIPPGAGVTLVLPKVTSAPDLVAYARASDPRLPLLPLIECPTGVFECRTIVAAHARISGVAFGSEDFAAAAGIEPNPETLSLPGQMVALAAASCGLPAFGLLGSLANYRDMARFQAEAALTKRLGFHGALTIHPAQVDVANAVFAPTPETISWAETVLTEAGEGGARASQLGMIDAPVVRRAEAILARARGKGKSVGNDC
ncbi:MAG: CoA ester lyase [Rhizobiales bacterium]|nr:CoA ester lyase [Hyphomicrobiales bacterium]